jgi:hypothetical protein
MSLHSPHLLPPFSTSSGADNAHRHVPSLPIVLGFRVRKVYWKVKEWHTTDDVAGRTLDDSKEEGVEERVEIVGDFGVDETSVGELFVVKEGLDGLDSANWVLP